MKFGLNSCYDIIWKTKQVELIRWTANNSCSTKNSRILSALYFCCYTDNLQCLPRFDRCCWLGFLMYTFSHSALWKQWTYASGLLSEWDSYVCQPSTWVSLSPHEMSMMLMKSSVQLANCFHYFSALRCDVNRL